MARARAAAPPRLQLGRLDLRGAAGVAHPVGRELAVLPEHERLRPLVDPPGGQVLDLGHELAPQLDHEIPHPLAGGPRAPRCPAFGRGKSCHIAWSAAIGPTSSDRSVSVDQIVARYLRLSPRSSAKLVQRGIGLAQGGAVLESPGGEEVVGVIGLLPLVEVDDRA